MPRAVDRDQAFADLASKGSLIVISTVAARRLPPASFGVFALGSMLGWTVAVMWHLRRRAVSWRSPDQVRLQPDDLKRHTQSHRRAVLERFQATVDTLMRMAKPPRRDDLFRIFPDLPGLQKRSPAAGVARVHLHVQETRDRAGENILRQKAATERVRAAIAGRRRR